MTAQFDWLVSPLLEGAIILAIGAVGLATRNALIFSSLGATGYEQIEKSRTRSAHPYNVVVGHAVGLACGFASVAMLKVWNEPAVLSSHQLAPGRLWASVIAVALTVLFNQILKSTQPAACSTALLIALGSFSNWYQAALIMGGVIAIAVIGEPLRRLRIRTTSPEQLH